MIHSYEHCRITVNFSNEHSCVTSVHSYAFIWESMGGDEVLNCDTVYAFGWCKFIANSSRSLQKRLFEI
jgi:hypothetical protein